MTSIQQVQPFYDDLRLACLPSVRVRESLQKTVLLDHWPQKSLTKINHLADAPTRDEFTDRAGVHDLEETLRVVRRPAGARLARRLAARRRRRQHGGRPQGYVAVL